MKNVFRLLGVAFLASTMLVACGSDDATEYTVTANPNDASMGSVTGGGKYEEGKSCTLTATANEGYEFVNWSDNATANPYTFTVTENKTLTANFQKKNGTGGGGGGTEQEIAQVTFDGTPWTATTVGCGYANGKFVTQLFSNYDDKTNSKMMQINGGSAVGTFASGNGSAYTWLYMENGNDLVAYNGQNLPRWQNNGFNQTITAIDFNTNKIAFTAEGSMYDLSTLNEEDNTAVIKQVSVNVNTTFVSFTFSKGLNKVEKAL